MLSPHDNRATAAHGYPFEQQVAIESLPRLILALARALGESGIGGATIQSLFADAVHVECVSCGMSVSGADLNAITLATGATATLGNKLERLRLGYCARNTCSSRFYLIRFKDRPDVVWSQVWASVEASLSGPPAPQSQTESAPPSVNAPAAWWYRQFVQRPIPLAFVSVLLLAVFVRSGCRIPGISPKARVFIVRSGPGQSSGTATNAPGRYIAR